MTELEQRLHRALEAQLPDITARLATEVTAYFAERLGVPAAPAALPAPAGEPGKRQLSPEHRAKLQANLQAAWEARRQRAAEARAEKAREEARAAKKPKPRR